MMSSTADPSATLAASEPLAGATAPGALGGVTGLAGCAVCANAGTAANSADADRNRDALIVIVLSSP